MINLQQPHNDLGANEGLGTGALIVFDFFFSCLQCFKVAFHNSPTAVAVVPCGSVFGRHHGLFGVPVGAFGDGV